jgi:hypothetical protein
MLFSEEVSSNDLPSTQLQIWYVQIAKLVLDFSHVRSPIYVHHRVDVILTSCAIGFEIPR